MYYKFVHQVGHWLRLQDSVNLNYISVGNTGYSVEHRYRLAIADCSGQ